MGGGGRPRRERGKKGRVFLGFFIGIPRVDVKGASLDVHIPTLVLNSNSSKRNPPKIYKLLLGHLTNQLTIKSSSNTLTILEI